MTEREAVIALNMVSGIGAILVKRLKERFGACAAAFEASEAELAAVPLIGPSRARSFYRSMRESDYAGEIARAERNGVALTTWDDPAYPAELLKIADPPLVFYSRGDMAALSRPCISMIGTRRASIYGGETARRFAYQLAGAGYTVVSGLAHGIDTESHRGALQAHGTTVGVLGGALNCFYPKENTGLAKEMVAGGGAVITEYPFGREPDRQTFPMRNRIVSGLSKGVLVIESPLNGGTMITVKQALEQGRPVMAVPGRIDSPSSQGCHRLIREGARLVTNVDEVLEELNDLFTGMGTRRPVAPGTDKAPPKVAEGRPRAVLSPEERSVFQLLTTEGVGVDELVRRSGLDAGRVGAILIGLQIKRLAKSLPGCRFATTAGAGLG